jgi:hydrogenase expression/formation protein HypD
MNLALYRDPEIARKLLAGIHKRAEGLGTTRIMEVCGTHTMEIGRLGLRALLPATVELISGPGCPVCVTPGAVIDAAVELALAKNVTILTFGDMIRVPGDAASLQHAKASNGRVAVVSSSLQALQNAAENPSREHVFIAVGFETTLPSTARTVLLARERAIRNLSFLVCHRIVPPALDALIADPDIGIRGFMLPGHVSAIIGEKPYERLTEKNIPSAITGFEPVDILAGIHAIIDMIAHGTAAVRNQYPRVVRPEGNPRALAMIDRVFEIDDALWRGIGTIPRSGMVLRKEYADFDAAKRYDLKPLADTMPKACSCGNVLKGKIHPDECPLFGKKCTPDNPVGPCMVSTEGSCAAYYRFGR